jgi:NADH-quinone oxidoreductase subunit I
MASRTAPGLGLLKGLGVTLKTMLKPAATQQYPHQRPTLAPRTRGVIALMDENCTVCMLCARECPDWCIYIDSHKETVPPAKEGGRERTRNVLDRFAIDFALCMYCGICVEVCPFDALWWSPEFEYAEYDQANLLHEMDKLREWADTVPAPPELEEGAVRPAEVVTALEKHAADIAAAEQAVIEAERAREAAANAPDVPAKKPVPEKPTIADVELEGETLVDQEVFDQLIADGKSERMARAKAKAAWVKGEKAKQLGAAVEAWEAEVAEIEAFNADVDRQAAAAAAGGGGGAEKKPVPDKPTMGDVELEGETEMDQELFDQLVADGKSERLARGKAKASWVKARKAEKLEELVAAWETEKAEIEQFNADIDAAASAGSGGGGTTTAAPPKPTLADVELEGEVQVDQAVFDQLIADGKSERMARSKAKAAWVKAQKQKVLDEQLVAWESEHGAGAAGDGAADVPVPTLGSVKFEGEVEIDQAVYDALIAEGKSERIARSKAKAAFVKAQKQKQLDEGGEA